MSRVRDALVASVTNRWPSVRCQIKKAVDGSRRQLAGFGAGACPGDMVEDPGHLGRGEVGIDHQTGSLGDLGLPALRPSQASAVRRSCQTRAGAIGLPGARSQTIVVSR